MKNLQNDLFLRACKKEKTERTPIWVMRQAGRYLPEYRAVREKSDFLTMCKTPELASEVTIQPVDLIGVDAAIIFSDILVIPEAMGMELIMNEGVGPVFPKPVSDEASVRALKNPDPYTDLKYVMDAVSLTKKNLDGRVPLIGFSGAPWTLLTYMVEGKGSKTFSKIKKFIYTRPDLAHQVLEKLTVSIISYLKAKVESGCDAIQIFDTWGGLLSPADFNTFSLPYISKIVAEIKKTGVPVIVFAKGVHSSLEEIAATGCDVTGLDWTFDIGSVRKKIGDKVVLQGNLDPTILYAGHDRIKEEAERVLASFGHGSGHVFNLGHGIHPDTPPENLKCLVDYIKTESHKYHN